MNTDSFMNYLKDYNLKNTKVRRKIFEILSNAKHPIDAIHLTNRIGVNKTSIYRELKVLRANSIILEIDFSDGKKRYELASLTHHHHLICTNCNSVSDVVIKTNLHEEEKLIEKEHSFKIERHSLEFFGLCVNCQ